MRPFVVASLTAAVLGCGRAPGPPVSVHGTLVGPDSTRIFYRADGVGRDTVIVVHGGPGAGIGDIRPDVEPLARNRVVIFYDQRGGGRSELPQDTTRLAPQDFVGELEAVRQHFGLERMDLVAHSFGAIIVAEYARTHPDRIARIVFLAATGPSRQQAAQFYQRRPPPSDTATARRLSEVLRSLLEGTAPDPVAACREYEDLGKDLAAARGEFTGVRGSTCDMPPEAVRYYYHFTARLGPAGFGNWDYTGSLGRVGAPVLVVDGARDTAGLPMERAWARAFPDARLLVIPDAGRAAHAERPDVVFSAIDQFLAGTWPSAAVREE